MQDEEYIAQFVDEGNQEAFQAVVSRYSAMVYSVCVRELGDKFMAEDASQAVFITLARKAHTLRRRAALPRWLFRTALFVVSNMKRDEKLRKKREKEASLMYGNVDTDNDNELWKKTRTHLNGMIDSLGSRYKDAVLCYFIQGKSQKETAAELGCSEDAVRMRISRALKKMRKLLKKKGVSVPAAALTSFLAQRALEAAPSGLTVSCHAASMAALAGNAAAFSKALLISEGVIQMMMWAKIKMAAVVVTATAIVSTGVPVAVSIAKAEETLPDIGAEASVVNENRMDEKDTSKETPLMWKEIGNPKFYSQYHPSTGKESKAHAVWRDSKSYRSGWSVRYIASSEKNLEQYPSVDFGSKMAVAVWRTLFGPKYSLAIDCVVETGSEVRVKYKADCILKPPPGGRMRSASPFQCLIEVERREKPVVFYENGKKVAEVLPFRRITGPFWYGDTAYRKINSNDDLFNVVTRYYGAASKNDSDKQTWLNEMRNWVDLQKINFKKEMVLAAFQGPVQKTSDAKLCITHAAIINGHISITLKRIPGLTEGGVSYPFDIIVCPRRDLPVVFYENGKEVARGVQKGVIDKKLSKFLEAAKYASTCIKATVTGVPEEKGGPGYCWLKVRCDKALYHGTARVRSVLSPKSTERTIKMREPTWASAYRTSLCAVNGMEWLEKFKPDHGFRPKDILLLCGNPDDGDTSIKWSRAREKAVRSALAPGWDFNAPICPRCPKMFEKLRARCIECGGVTTRGMKLCAKCGHRLGQCLVCRCELPGPATRRVNLRLETFSPLHKTRLTGQQSEDARQRKVRIPLGQAPGVFLHVEGTAKQVPELMCWTRPHDLGTCQTLFFLVEAKSKTGFSASVVLPEFNRTYYQKMTLNTDPRLKAFSDLKQWKLFTLQKTDSSGLPIFTDPGIYTVRVAAGRLISNPVHVTVRQNKKAMIRNADIPVAEVLGFSPDGVDLAVVLNTSQVAVASIGNLWENPLTSGIRMLGTLPPPASTHWGTSSKWKPDRTAIAARWVEPGKGYKNAAYTIFDLSGKATPRHQPCTRIDTLWRRADLEYRIGKNGLEKRTGAEPVKYRTVVTNEILNRKLQDTGWRLQRVLKSGGKAVWLEAVKYSQRARIGKSPVPRSLKILTFENGNLYDRETYTETAGAVKTGTHPIKAVAEDGQSALVYYHSTTLDHSHYIQKKPGNSAHVHPAVLVRLDLSGKPRTRPFAPKNPSYTASSIRLLSVSPRADRMIVITRTYRHMIRRYQTQEQFDDAKKRLGCRIERYWGKTPEEAMVNRRRRRRKPGGYYSGEWKLMFPVLRFWRISFDRDEPEPISPPITFGPEAPEDAYLTQLPFAHSKVYPFTQHPKGCFAVLSLKSADQKAKLLIIKLPAP